VLIVASCWAIGRNSAEATKARLIRAVRAALAALLALPAGFLAWVTALDSFFVFLDLDAADPAGCDVEWVEVCPATGSTTRRKASAHASRGIEVGEAINLMPSL
jgi:hypothetical protein